MGKSGQHLLLRVDDDEGGPHTLRLKAKSESYIF
jgi:hypothetical protein